VMPAVVLLAVLAVAVLLVFRLGARGGTGDLPARIVAAAADRLPADRRDCAADDCATAGGSGSARRSSFPLGVNGSRSSVT
jgi:hypothetical protein